MIYHDTNRHQHQTHHGILEPRTEIEEEEKDHSQPPLIANLELNYHNQDFEAKQMTEDVECRLQVNESDQEDEDYLSQIDRTSQITPC